MFCDCLTTEARCVYEKYLQIRILEKVALYASQPNPLEFAEPLTGYDMYRFRVGDYRVALQINQNIMYIKSVRHRDKAYRRM